jgi:hypothetical protein
LRCRRSKTEADPDPSMAIDPSADDMVCHCAVLSINDARSDRLIMGATAFGKGVQGRILDSLASYRACFSGSKGGGRRRGHSVPACFSILIAGRASDWAASRTVQQHPPPSPCTANVFYPATGRPAAPRRRSRHAHAKRGRKKQAEIFSWGPRWSGRVDRIA